MSKYKIIYVLGPQKKGSRQTITGSQALHALLCGFPDTAYNRNTGTKMQKQVQCQAPSSCMPRDHDIKTVLVTLTTHVNSSSPPTICFCVCITLVGAKAAYFYTKHRRAPAEHACNFCTYRFVFKSETVTEHREN